MSTTAGFQVLEPRHGASHRQDVRSEFRHGRSSRDARPPGHRRQEEAPGARELGHRQNRLPRADHVTKSARAHNYYSS